jgi:integrase/transcription elongation factor Elf1
MIEVDWKKDYQDEFICPACNNGHLRLSGFHRGKKKFTCKNCQSQTVASINLNRRSLYLNSRLQDEHINWEKDYQGEFICPKCQTVGMVAWGIHKQINKRKFRCPNCRHVGLESSTINIQPIEDPINPGVIWYTNHRYKNFICPECQKQNIYIHQIDKYGKKIFRCRTCKKTQYDSIQLTRGNLSFFNSTQIPTQPFNFDEDKWDLRAINPNFDILDLESSIANFSLIKPDWFQQKVKKYVEHLCKAGQSNTFGTIKNHLSALRSFSQYLAQTNITGFDQINRSLILDYLARAKKINKKKLGGLRNFFMAGTLRSWFTIDQNIIRDEDYPKERRGNPDPLSDIVREQIEQNLHKLPDPIARMWIICFFAAMRPSELALLKKDCLVQEGQHWKLVWGRKKGKDYHEVPISRTIAKVVQQQQEYINNLWGSDWEYLFCHCHGLSEIHLSQPKLEPVKKVIPSHENPLVVAIRCLIHSENILDENGQIAKFSPKLLRPTRLTQLFDQGHDLAVVSAWAGHKHLATTSTYYTQVSCELMEREAGHIQQALVNSDGHRLAYESLPKSFWEKPQAHKLELVGTHINTPIYGYCGLDLDKDCDKFRACYTCSCFVAIPEKLPQYIKVRDELRAKERLAYASGQDVLVEQFGRQADQLDKIIVGLQEAV